MENMQISSIPEYAQPRAIHPSEREHRKHPFPFRNVHLLKLMNSHSHSNITQSSQFTRELTLCYSFYGFREGTMAYIYYYNISQNKYFLPQTLLCADIDVDTFNPTIEDTVADRSLCIVFSLLYILSSRIVRVTRQNPVSHKQK